MLHVYASSASILALNNFRMTLNGHLRYKKTLHESISLCASINVVNSEPNNL